MSEHMALYFREDRWGSCECKLCDIRLKNEAAFRSHVQSTSHAERHAASVGDAGTPTGRAIRGCL